MLNTVQKTREEAGRQAATLWLRRRESGE